jgi:hypothetical protein
MLELPFYSLKILSIATSLALAFDMLAGVARILAS